MPLSYIFILHQTTTGCPYTQIHISLSYIFILHQTTTWLAFLSAVAWLSYIFILHQTTTIPLHRTQTTRCLISSFYIKPQPLLRRARNQSVVLYLHSTSNHNQRIGLAISVSVVLYLHSTSNHNANA